VQGKYAADNPDEAQANETSATDYYARLEGTPSELPKRRPNIVDVLADMASMCYQICSVDKIITIQTFEHLSPAHATIALSHWHGILRYHAPLIISIPDMYETLDMIETEPKFAMRHLLGRQRGDYYNTHHAWYTRATLSELLEFHGFKVEHLQNFHFYPAIVVKAVKR
jgi:predicted SAM-dependent methyltransferase